MSAAGLAMSAARPRASPAPRGRRRRRRAGPAPRARSRRGPTIDPPPPGGAGHARERRGEHAHPRRPRRRGGDPDHAQQHPPRASHQAVVLRGQHGRDRARGDGRRARDAVQGEDRVPGTQRRRRRVSHRHAARARPRTRDEARERRQARARVRAGIHGQRRLSGPPPLPLRRRAHPRHDGLGRRRRGRRQGIHRRRRPQPEDDYYPLIAPRTSSGTRCCRTSRPWRRPRGTAR